MDTSYSPTSVASGRALPADDPTALTLELARSQHAADPEGYSYGPPPPGSERESNYISDSELLTWLAQRQNGMYGELRGLMDVSRERGKLTEDLAHFRAMVDRGDDLSKLQAEAARMLEAYAGTEYEAKLEQLFACLGVGTNVGGMLAQLDGVLAIDLVWDALSRELEATMDALGRDDQLALIDIQSLTADIRETSQLVSNLMASSSQATNTIVGNLRA